MTKEQAIKIIYDKTPICRIIEITQLRDCWEIIGEVGGDVLIYRIYNNGEITER